MTKKSIELWNWNQSAPSPQDWTWVLPQTLAWINQCVQLVRTEGKISFEHTLRALLNRVKDGTVLVGDKVLTKKGFENLWNNLLHSPRGGIIPGVTQTSTGGVRWNSGVPLILSSFKQYRGVMYEDWNWNDPAYRWWLDQDLCDVVVHRHKTFEQEDLVAWREQGRTIKSGATVGTQKSIQSVTNLTGVDHPEFKSLSRLAKLMVCQCWCWYPGVVHQYMFQSLVDFDHPQPPLVDHTVVLPPQEVVDHNLSSSRVRDMWDIT